MASPFRYFRKNVKPLLATLMVLLIIAWLGGGALTGYLGRSQSGAGRASQAPGAVAVRWDGGSLTNQQVAQLVGRRRLLNEFLRRVEISGMQDAYQAGVEATPLRVVPLRLPDNPQQGIERSVVETRIFADAARQAGMRISNDAVTQYLDQLGRGKVTRDQMRADLNTIQQHGRATIDDIIAALRDEMLAKNYINSNQYSFLTVTPEQRWQDWLRVNQYVVVEAAAVPAESLLAQVKPPTDAELQAFFEKYKDREPSPQYPDGVTELPSPTPGFKIPRKIDLQFIEGNFESFRDKAEEKVTDDEIAKYYEAHKDPMFIKADTALMEDKGEKKDSSKPEKPAAPDAKPAEDSKPKEAPAKPPEAETKPAPPESKDAGAKNAAPSPPTPPPAKEEKEKGDAAPKDGKQSSLESPVSKRVFHLVGFQQDAGKESGAKDGATKAETAATPPASSPPASATTPAPPAAAETKADEKGGPPPAKPAPPTAPSAKPDTATPPPATPAAPKKPPEFQPLDQVKDVIRRRIAEEKAAEQLDKLAKDIDGQLEGVFSKYLNAVLTAQTEKTAPPAPPSSLTDLAPLAEKNGLKSGATGAVSYLQLRDLPVGKSFLPEVGRYLRDALFFTREYDLYQPISTVDADKNRYIVMKKSDAPAHVPTLAEVPDEVVKAWKAEQASKLAEQRAKELAKKARESKAPLTTALANDPTIKIVRTDPFAELTGGDVGLVNGQFQQQPYRLGQPDGIVAPGPAFMKEVFGLQDGQVGVAFNNDHTIAYVIRVVEHNPPLAELRTAYLGEANSWLGLRSMTQSHFQEVASSLLADLTTGANLKWERDPDKVEHEEVPDAG